MGRLLKLRFGGLCFGGLAVLATFCFITLQGTFSCSTRNWGEPD